MISFFWYLSLCLLFLLCWRTVTNDLERRFPGFVSYLYFSAFQWLSLFLAGKVHLPPADYQNLYAGEELVSTFLLAMCALDVYRNAYGPLRAQPSWVPRNVLRMVFSGITTSVLVGTIFHARHSDMALRVMNTVDQYVIGSLCFAFWIIVIYSFPLRRPWRRHNAGIAAGFVLCLTVNLLTVYIRALGSQSSALVAAYIGPLSFDLSVVWWCWRLWHPMPAMMFTRDRVQQELEIQHAFAQMAGTL